MYCSVIGYAWINSLFKSHSPHMSLFSILKVMLLDNLGTLHSQQRTSFSTLIYPTIDSWSWTDQEAFITSNYIYVWSSWMLMCSGTSLSSSESLVTFSFVEDPRLDEKEIGRGTSQEGFWDSGKMLVDWINRATSIVEVTNNRGENVSFSFTTTKLGQFSQRRYNNSWLSPSIYGGEILRQASLRSCPNGFSLSNCLKTSGGRKVVTCEKCSNLAMHFS